jgi:lysozyme family protein
MTFLKSLELVLKSEGGFSNHKEDGGGATNFGVTQKTWEDWVGHPVSEADMKSLTIEKITPLYKMKYWNPAYCDVLQEGLNYAVFDCAVNMGTGRAVKTLQQAVGCHPDGVIGPRTMERINALPVELILEKFSNEKRIFYQGLKNFPTFGKGWLNRVEEVKKNALIMVNADKQPKQTP